MKIFNEEHEAIINVFANPKNDKDGNNHKEGDLVLHQFHVDGAKMYFKEGEYDTVAREIHLSRKLIFDLYNQFVEIESKEELLEVEPGLPF